ncbi:MAG TPA: EscU/YscU/HrcU family type III secretion system export apparatus switch protein [Kofleriaceae bacterium]|nr:EscU/YscU/HrcU family type III secretion system export apparatus switch protein [Kofleriaceae bacterium]
MAEHRPFPPSARRLALARRAGLHAASPLVVGAAACGAALLAVTELGSAAAARLGAWIAAACRGAGEPLAAGGGGGPSDAGGAPGALLTLADAPSAIAALALPVLAAAAGAAIVAHVAQTRALWLPRRRLPSAPALAAGGAERAGRAGFGLAAAAVVGGTALGWLWWAAPRLAALPRAAASSPTPSSSAAASASLAGAALVVSALAALAIAWALLGALDALAQHARLAQALRMTAHEKRQDDRLAGPDPRWRARRARALHLSPSEAVAGAAVLVLGDDAAVAVSWDAARRPIPTRTASGRGARATQLLGLARRHRIPVHRDASLAAALAAADGPVPEPHWARLAEIIAAVRRS